MGIISYMTSSRKIKTSDKLPLRVLEKVISNEKSCSITTGNKKAKRYGDNILSDNDGKQKGKGIWG